MTEGRKVSALVEVEPATARQLREPMTAAERIRERIRRGEATDHAPRVEFTCERCGAWFSLLPRVAAAFVSAALGHWIREHRLTGTCSSCSKPRP